MPVKCPGCGTSNPDTGRSCSLCGASLQNEPTSEGPASREATNTDPVGPPSAERTGSFEADIRGIVIGGTVAGRYLVKEMLGRGGVAMVFRAHDNSLHEEIALKVFPNLTRQDPADLDRFKREVLVNRRISHVNVIRVYDFGSVGDDAYLTMELLAGGTLAEKIEAKPLPIAEAVEIAIGISEGLQAAHQAGIIHRDVKPENVLFDGGGRAKLVDFGLARLTDASTHTKGFSGTPFYMSPEQAEGAEITVQTDVYSLGVLLFELFTGQLPFFADSLVRIAMLHVNEIPPRPSDLRPGLPVALEQLVLACLAKKPESRPQGVGAVAASLRKFRRDGGLDSARGLDDDPSFSVPRRRARMQSDSVQLPSPDRKSAEKTLDKIASPASNRETVIVRVDRDGSSAPRPAPPAPPHEREGSSAPRPIPVSPAPPRESSGSRLAAAPPRSKTPAVELGDLTELPIRRERSASRWLIGFGGLAAVVVAGAFAGQRLLPGLLGVTTPTPTAVVVAPSPESSAVSTPAPSPSPAVSSPSPSRTRNAAIPSPSPAATKVAPLPSPTPTASTVGAIPSPTSPPPVGFGFLTISTSPWAEVLVDGKLLGTTPLTQKRIPAGKHVVLITNSVQRYREEVHLNVRAGAECKFEPLPIYLSQKPKLRPPPGC